MSHVIFIYVSEDESDPTDHSLDVCFVYQRILYKWLPKITDAEAHIDTLPHLLFYDSTENVFLFLL